MPRMPRDGMIQRNTLGRSSWRTTPCLPGLRLTALGEFLADAVLAAVDGDLRLVQAGDRLDLDRVLRGAHPHALERMVVFQREDRADRDKALRRLRLHRRGRDELQVEDIVEGLSRDVGTSSGSLQPCELANPVTRTMSSLGSIVVRRTSTLVT